MLLAMVDVFWWCVNEEALGRDGCVSRRNVACEGAQVNERGWRSLIYKGEKRGDALEEAITI